jgi:hypothetical protein
MREIKLTLLIASPILPITPLLQLQRGGNFLKNNAAQKTMLYLHAKATLLYGFRR